MTIADKLRYLGETKTLIKEAIQNKGVTVTDSDPFRSYAEKIGMIQSGGSGGEVIEAVVDGSVLPIEADKKVVVADIQASGQGAGALMPFDIAPFGSYGTTAWRVIRDTLFLITPSNSTSKTLVYKKTGQNSWSGKVIPQLGYDIHPNDKITLLYNLSENGFGSPGKYYNHVTDTVEDINFDVEFPQTDASQQTGYFLTYDSKYLFAVDLYTVNGGSGGTEGNIGLYRIEENKETGKVYAYQIISPISITKPGGRQICRVSLDSHEFYIAANYSSSKTTDVWVSYDEGENALNVLSGQRANTQPSNIVSKYWHLYQKSVYHGRPTSGGGVAFTLQGTHINRTTMYKDIAYAFSSTDLHALKVPLNREQPKVTDFYVYDAVPNAPSATSCLFEDYKILTNVSNKNYPPNWAPKVIDLKTGVTESTPEMQRMPIFLLDSGVGYFFSDDSANYVSKDIQVVAPVSGSYTNGEVLKTLDEGNFYRVISDGSTLTPFPMRFLNRGNSFIFNTFASTSKLEGSFFNDQETGGFEKFSFKGGTLSVDVDKAYATPSTSDLSFKVFSGEGLKTYTASQALSGLCFEFEGQLYAYKFSTKISSAGDGCYKVVLNDTDMTASFEYIDDGGNLSPIKDYVTKLDMSESATYPLTIDTSLYNRPVMTKDGKYFVGLAGSHTTHYSKIEKSPEGYPVLAVYEWPEKLKDLLYEQEILYFETYYPNGFGIQLTSGNFLLCEYDKGIETDLQIEVYNPLNSGTGSANHVNTMHFTSHKKYWYVHLGVYFYSNYEYGFVSSCGRREDLSSTYQTKVYSMQHSFAGADHVTGYLTGESYPDNNGKLIARVEVFRK
jgi:hypothetical protein